MRDEGGVQQKNAKETKFLVTFVAFCSTSVNIHVHPWLKTPATNSARYWSSNSTTHPTKKKHAGEEIRSLRSGRHLC